IFSKGNFVDTLADALRPAQHHVLETSVSDLMSEIGREDDPWKMPPAQALKFIAKRDRVIASVGDTVASQLETAVKNRSNVEEIPANLKDAFNHLSKFEARRVAMTEVGVLDGYARHEGMKGTGIEYKSWLSSHGENVRPAHSAAEAAGPVPIDEP